MKNWAMTKKRSSEILRDKYRFFPMEQKMSGISPGAQSRYLASSRALAPLVTPLPIIVCSLSAAAGIRLETRMLLFNAESKSKRSVGTA